MDTHDLEPALAALGATRLSSDKTVFGVVGPAGSQEVRAGGPVYKKSGMPFLSPSATNADLTSGSPTFYRVVGSDDRQATVDALFMVRKLKAKKVFIVDDQTVYSTGLANVAGNVLRKANVQVQRQSVGQKVTDFSSLVSKISSDRTSSSCRGRWRRTRSSSTCRWSSRGRRRRSRLGGLDSAISPLPGATSLVRARHPRPQGQCLDHQGVRKRYGRTGYVWPAELRVCAGALDGDEEVVCGQERVAEVLKNLRTTKLPATILALPVQFDGKGRTSSRSSTFTGSPATSERSSAGASEQRAPIPRGWAARVAPWDAEARGLGVLRQQIVNGVTLGSVYALISLGYSLVYGILKLLDFAHGDVYMIGAFIGFGVLAVFGGASNLSIPIPLVFVLMFSRRWSDAASSG